MRFTKSLALVALFFPAIASADPRALPELAKPKLSPSKSLAATEVAEQMRFYTTDINKCYLDTAGPGQRGYAATAGHLEIKLSIHRTGKLDAIDISTPGLSKAAARKIASCVKAVVDGTEFPERKAPTVAIVPYFYQHTTAPGSGPQLSCWNPRGCR